MVDKPKYRIEKDINNILRTVQKREGMGRMVVEVEEIVSDCMFVFSKFAFLNFLLFVPFVNVFFFSFQQKICYIMCK